MTYKHVVCIDGTWNRPGTMAVDPVDNQEKDCPTNVQRLWNALSGRTLDQKVDYGRVSDLKSGDGEVVYFDGVGSTGTVVAKWFEGGTGTGTSERIRDAHRFLAERWDSGDEIYVFGFSRGAFAARSLTGFLNMAGLPQERSLLDEDTIGTLYQPYRNRYQGPLPDGHAPVPVKFVGVWDTVGSLAFGDSFNDFHVTSPPNVEHFAHALALDERRKPFLPTYWGPKQGQTQSAREVWFSGVHSNVGGGYTNTGLSDIALFWMIQQAKVAGLTFDDDTVASVDSVAALATMRDSYTEFLDEFGVVGAMLARLGWDSVHRQIQPGQLIHESVLQRMEHDYAGKPYVPAAQASDKATLTADYVAQNEEPWLKV